MNVSEMFGDNLVLQREMRVPVWGEAAPGETVTVSIQGQTVKTKANELGKWTAYLAPMSASEQETLTVACGAESRSFRNVAVGEVWLAAGQSNMEFHMRYDKDYSLEVRHCENPNIRVYDYPVVESERARAMFDYSENYGFWKPCTPENLQWFSAVGYYFARDLQKTLGVPVGIVGMNCGGSRSHNWMDEESIRKYGPAWLEEYEQGLLAIGDLAVEEELFYTGPKADHSHPFDDPVSDRLMYGVTLPELKRCFEAWASAGALKIGPWHEWRPAGLYHMMTERVMPFAVRGVLWYQGESDEAHPELYADMMHGLIALWREKWGRKLPFLMAQLAPFGEELAPGGRMFPKLREIQEEISRREEEVYLASTGDVGHPYDIHPKEKQPVGKRMALLAEGHIYGMDVLCDAPTPDALTREGNTVLVHFANAAGGLVLKGERLNALEVLAGGKTLPEGAVSAVVEGETLRIVLPTSVSEQAIELRFAMTPYFVVNLYNRSGVAALPFVRKT